MRDCPRHLKLAIGPWGWRVLAALLILTASALHLFYLACDCPLDLAPDEAHYWHWSRQLDWSYYSKGPAVAYLIRASCDLFGPLSRQWTGTDMLAVRLPAVVCSALLLASLYVLTAQVYRREGLATGVVAVALTLPPVAAGAALMTIDSPFTCCWGWALVFGFQAVMHRSAWAWPVAGLFVGLGILAKYTMVLWLPCLGLFLLTSPSHRDLLRRPGFWVAVLVVVVCCLPIVWWNVRHDWVTFRHVSGQAGIRQAGPWVRWLGPLNYIGTQFALLLGYWFVAWAAALMAHVPWREEDAGKRYLWWMSVPVFGLFLAFSLKNGGGEPNWPVTAYVSGLVLSVGWLAGHLQSPGVWHRRATALGLAAFCGLGVFLTCVMHYSGMVHPLLARLAGPASERHPFPVRRWDPTCRLRGWRALAAEIDRIRAELLAQGVDPVLAASGWNLPGELAFYCQDHPAVYSLGLALGDRHSQYDVWRPNPVWDADRFHGQTFIYVTDVVPVPELAFAHVDPPHVIRFAEAGFPIAQWTITVCHGYRGFSPWFSPAGQHY